MEFNSASNGGLCSTCRNASVCIYLENRPCGVICCDEFDPVNTPKTNPAFTVTYSATPDVVQSNGKLGLCNSCEDGDRCTFRAPGGVWHCEEYR